MYNEPHIIMRNLAILGEHPETLPKIAAAARRAYAAWRRGRYDEAATALRSVADAAADDRASVAIRTAYFDALEGLEDLEAIDL